MYSLLVEAGWGLEIAFDWLCLQKTQQHVTKQKNIRSAIIAAKMAAIAIPTMAAIDRPVVVPAMLCVCVCMCVCVCVCVCGCVHVCVCV